mgnify:CR=1 FL=1|jgi:chaperonin GroES|tara:strand:- start:90 stop:359 length:270 start_codon:yes stop_codon:yes gene_type:complete
MIQPFGKRLLIQRKKAETQSAGGILMPEQVVNKKFNEGTVIAAADDCKISVGDYVMFGEYTGHEVSQSGEQYLLILEEDVLCLDVEEDN